jgi:sugar O-acyltransferase (sialic acid O-acetyltransferase NeuD family)
MKKKLVIFGTRDLAQLARFYFELDSEYQPVAFTVDRQYLTEPTFEGLPLVAFEEIEKLYPPDEHTIFVPMTQAKMGRIRREKYEVAKAKGYRFATYISAKATYYGTPVGENTFIFEDNTIQPFTEIGNNVVLWSGNHIGHSSKIQDHVFLTSHVVISGHCVIEPHCFFGVNSTVRDFLTIAEGTLVAMGAIITKNTIPYGVYYGGRSIEKTGLKSTDVM